MKKTTSMRDMRVGVVGLGWAAGAHIEAFKHVQGAQVTAVCSRRRLDPRELETHRVIFAADLSAKNGEPVKLSQGGHSRIT
jgi:glutamate dehydrogenase/leucine dehydrogenase